MKMVIYREILLVQMFFFLSSIRADLPNPEINDQFDTQPKIATDTSSPTTEAEPVNILETGIKSLYNLSNVIRKKNYTPPGQSLYVRLYTLITNPIKAFLSAPKVASVLRNVGTCIVNGALELVTYYLPAPLIPLIASAAGTIIPFEPVVMLRDKMPVNSYRRAFSSAVNSFVGTFDKFKMNHNFDDDPYMTQTFNRRMMSVGDPPKINRRESSFR